MSHIQQCSAVASPFFCCFSFSSTPFFWHSCFCSISLCSLCFPFLSPYTVQFLPVYSLATLIFCLQNKHFWLFFCTCKWSGHSDAFLMILDNNSTSLLHLQISGHKNHWLRNCYENYWELWPRNLEMSVSWSEGQSCDQIGGIWTTYAFGLV